MRSSTAETEVTASKAWVEDGWVCVRLADEREVRFPAAKMRRLRKGTPGQVAHIELTCEGTGLHRPEFDEDLSVAGILDGRLGQ